MKTIAEILPNLEEELYRTIMDAVSVGIRVALPGIVESFDASTQTARVRSALRERVRQPDLSYKWLPIPILLDVPIVIPRAGGYALTLPVQSGDECLLVFGDACIDAWWQNGGIQNQLEKRRHDLSDAFAILAPTSQPKRLSNYATDAAQLRTEDGSVTISITQTGISMKAPANSITANGNVLG